MILALAAPAAATARPFSFDEYDRIVGVSDARISPDGKSILIVVGHVDAEKDRTLRELVVVDAGTGARRTITTGTNRASDPQWSPDGSEISYVAAAGKGEDAVAQVFVMPASGGAAHPVTHSKYGVEEYAWRPDGKAIAYLTPDAPPNEADVKRHEDLFHVGDDSYLTHAPPTSTHLWVQTLDGSGAQRITQGSWSIYPDALSWSASGKQIAFEREPSGRYDAVVQLRTAIVDVATKRVTVLGKRWSWMSAFAPRGNRVAFSQARGLPLIHNDLTVTQLGGATIGNAAPSLDRDVDFITWLPDGKSLLVGADDRVTHALWKIDADGGVRRIALHGVLFGGGTVANNGAVAFVGSTPAHPDELYYLDPSLGRLKRLTNYNDAIAALHLAPTREFTWHNDGFLEDGALTYPLGYVRGKKYPLALVIHGGPTDGASTASFSPLAQVLAAHGFFVLQPNYRGSDNLGFRYAQAIVGDNPAFGAGSDCYAGARALIATGMIDPARVGVSGWSAGGWMTSWLITHYPLFKAGVTGAAIDDVILQATLSEIDSYMPILFGGLTPWSPKGHAAYVRNSPLTYAQNDNAATLILSDTTDPRAPTPQAYEFFSKLRAYGKNVQFMAAPAYGHHPSDPDRNRAIDKTWAAWLIDHLSK